MEMKKKRVLNKYNKKNLKSWKRRFIVKLRVAFNINKKNMLMRFNLRNFCDVNLLMLSTFMSLWREAF